MNKKIWLLALVLLVGGWMVLVARYAPQAEAELPGHSSLMILLPAVWRGLKPGLPSGTRLR